MVWRVPWLASAWYGVYAVRYSPRLTMVSTVAFYNVRGIEYIILAYNLY